MLIPTRVICDFEVGNGSNVLCELSVSVRSITFMRTVGFTLLLEVLGYRCLNGRTVRSRLVSRILLVYMRVGRRPNLRDHCVC